MHKLLKARLTWPVMYQMFGLLYINKDLFAQQLDIIETTTEQSIQRNLTLVGYEKVYYLLAHRAKEIRLFLYRVGAKKAASAVHTYLKVSQVHSKQKAFRVMLKSKHFNEALADALSMTLVMDTSDLDWRCTIAANKGANHLIISKDHKPVTKVNIDSFDSKWIKYKYVKNLIQKEIRW